MHRGGGRGSKSPGVTAAGRGTEQKCAATIALSGCDKLQLDAANGDDPVLSPAAGDNTTQRESLLCGIVRRYGFAIITRASGGSPMSRNDVAGRPRPSDH